MTVWAALAFVALAASAYAQSGDPAEPVYQYGTPQGGLGVYADTAARKVGVTIISQNSENRGDFAASRVLTWLDAGMKDSLTDGSGDHSVSLTLTRQTACALRLSETDHADYTVTIPCGQLPLLTQGFQIAAGQAPIYYDFQVEKKAAMVRGSRSSLTQTAEPT